jgi:dihydrofolate reductase
LLTIIAAISKNGVIGGDGRIPWKLSSDLRRFKNTTVGKTVIMGRKTWESLPHSNRPLPHRENIVVTTQRDFQVEGASIAHSLAEAIARATTKEVFVIGGARLYKEAISLADRMLLTQVGADVEGDTFFPGFDKVAWELVETVSFEGIQGDEFPSTLEIYHRV